MELWTLLSTNLEAQNDLFFAYFMLAVALLAIREMIWKGIALWKAGKRQQIIWFIFIFIFNTAWLLPIIYLISNRKNKNLK